MVQSGQTLIYLHPDLRGKQVLTIEIRDNIESHCQGAQYSVFLNNLIPVFLRILDGNPVFISTSPEQVSVPSHSMSRPNQPNSGCVTASWKFSTDYL